MRAVTIRTKKQNGKQGTILAGFSFASLPYFRVDTGAPRVRVEDVPMPAGLPRAAVYTHFFHLDAVANFVREETREETREGPCERELYSHIITRLSALVAHIADVEKEPGGTTACELAHYDVLALPV